VIGNGVSGSRTGTVGCGSASGGKGIGAGFGFCGSDGSCGVTGGISGFSIESVFSAALRVISASSALKAFSTQRRGVTAEDAETPTSRCRTPA